MKKQPPGNGPSRTAGDAAAPGARAPRAGARDLPAHDRNQV